MAADTGVFLGIETSGEYTALALIREEPQVLARLVNELTQACHNEQVFKLLDRLFAEGSGFELTRLDGIGVTIGPGMFTSLRVGLSVAKGLAMTCGIALKGINTLDAMALTPHWTAAEKLPERGCPFLPRSLTHTRAKSIAPCFRERPAKASTGSTPCRACVDELRRSGYRSECLSPPGLPIGPKLRPSWAKAGLVL